MDSTKKGSTTARKDEHITLCLEKDIVFKGITNGLEEIKISPSLIVDIYPEEVNLSTKFLGKKIDFPVIISGMTGGTEKGKKINETIAEVCNDMNIAMGVGSQRAAIENKDLHDTYNVRPIAKDIPLIANLGIAQFLKGYGFDEAGIAIRMIQADALAIHLNPLQEFVQHEGDKKLSNAIKKIDELSKLLSTPIIVKGVGTGLTKKDAQLLAGLDIYALDIAGAGGTNWTKVEQYRDQNLKYLSQNFINWGVSTKESLLNLATVSGRTKFKIIASGGIWGGMDAVKALLLGADYVAFALPVLKAIAEGGADELKLFLKSYFLEMKITMAMLNLRDLNELKKERHKIIDLE